MTGISRLSHRHVGQRVGQLRHGGLHDRRVKRAGDGQRNRLHRAELRRQLGGPLAGGVRRRRRRCCRGRAGWRSAASRRRGPRRKAASTCALLEPENADHAARRGVGGGLHRGAASLHELQAVFEVHDAGEDQGRVLAEAQAGRGFARERRRRAIRSQAFERRQAATNSAGWLRIGRVEFFGRPFEAELRQVVAEDARRRDRTVAARPGATRPAACPMPTACAPWPGNKKAILLTDVDPHRSKRTRSRHAAAAFEPRA